MNAVKKLVYPLYDRIPDHIRFGRNYRVARGMISESRIWDKEKVERWLLSRFRNFLKEAYDGSPYYKEALENRSLSPSDIKSHNDIKKLPFMTKSMAQENLDKIVPQRFNKNELYYTTTGGSSGVPLGMYYLKKRAKPVEMAFVHEIWSMFGFNTNRRQVVIRGEVLKNGVVSKKGLTLLLSSYHLTQENMPQLIDAIFKYRPEYIQAYPSAIASVCSYMKEEGISGIDSLRLVMCSSENLYTFQSELVKKVFKVPLVNLYGNTEHTCIASNCSDSDKLHFHPLYGYVELINEAGEECTQEGETCEIVATGFTNPAFPMIRYRTGDIATYTRAECSCSWNYKMVSEIQGREQEFIVTSSGRKICIAAVNMHSDIFDHVKLFQFVQNTIGKVQFNYLPKPTFDDRHKERIHLELIAKLGHDTDIDMNQVEKIEPTVSGKQKFLIQNLAV